MAAATENLLFIQALLAHLDRLEELLGDEWSYFREQLLSIQHRVAVAEDEAEITQDVNEILDLLLDSSAAELVRSLLKQALTQAGSVEVTTRSVRMTDPTSGRSRDVDLSVGGVREIVAAGREEIIAASKALALRLLPREGNGYILVPIFYATDRRRVSKGFYGVERGDLEFGTAEISIPEDHRVGELEKPTWWKLQFHPLPREHVVLLSLTARERDVFMSDLRVTLKEAAEPTVLMFIHGYNVTFEDAARRTAQLAYDLNFQGIPMLYSWPSQGKRLMYTVDETNIEWSVPHLQEVLKLILTEIGAQSLHIIAHSMGNRALVNALRSLSQQTLPYGSAKLHQIVLAAPDIDAGVFRQLAREFSGTAERFTLYASSRDRALKVSKEVHGYARAGESGDNLVVLRGIDTIDASNVDTSLLGHSYYGENRSILADMFWLLKHGSSPPRFGMFRRELAGDPYWLFRP